MNGRPPAWRRTADAARCVLTYHLHKLGASPEMRRVAEAARWLARLSPRYLPCLALTYVCPSTLAAGGSAWCVAGCSLGPRDRPAPPRGDARLSPTARPALPRPALQGRSNAPTHPARRNKFLIQACQWPALGLGRGGAYGSTTQWDRGCVCKSGPALRHTPAASRSAAAGATPSATPSPPFSPGRRHVGAHEFLIQRAGHCLPP